MNNWWRNDKNQKSAFQLEIEQGARDLFYIKEEEDAKEDILQHIESTEDQCSVSDVTGPKV